VAVIGDPVAHSLSPAIHNAAFAETGLDWCCVALPVPVGRALDAMVGLRALGLRGASVTMPHKAAVIDGLDDVSHTARTLGSVNCIVAERDARLRGENTDGDGFVRGLAEDFGISPRGRSCAVLGAGGAARAVVHALAAAGAAEVVVLNRTAERARAAAELAGVRGRVGTADDLSSVDVVVNATPVGMAGPGGSRPAGDVQLPLDPGLLRPGQVVAELVYHPASTPLMEAAAARGARSANGVSMLVQQAAVAFELWTGRDAPVQAMRAAADAALAPGPDDPRNC
jgi:shikimate dehydrogenase